MRENMPGLARPVRIAPRSSLATATAFSIFSSASKSASSITSFLQNLLGSSRSDECSDLLTGHRSCDIALGKQVENQHRHLVVHTQAERRGVGDTQPTLDDLSVRDLVIQRRIWLEA